MMSSQNFTSGIPATVSTQEETGTVPAPGTAPEKDWTHAPTLAGERDDKPLAALCAEAACESTAEDPAPEVTLQLFLDEGRHGPHSVIAPGEPALEVFGHDLVERRLLGATPLKSGVTARARPVVGVGFALETLRPRRPWAVRRVAGKRK